MQAGQNTVGVWEQVWASLDWLLCCCGVCVAVSSGVGSTPEVSIAVYGVDNLCCH
jgi:hypothetical protein